MQVAVVGAGIAGVACARALQSAGHGVVVLDRGRVPGGRMASRRFHGRYADLGASYLTVQDPAFLSVVDDWHSRGLARPWTDRFAVWEAGRFADAKQGPLRWAAPTGLRSLVTDLASGLDVRQLSPVQSVTATAVDGVAYDAVVLAMPDPEALAVLDPSLTEERAAIEGRPWDATLVLAAEYATRTWDWDGVFVQGSQALEWVADDGARRGDGVPVLTAHSTPAHAATRLESRDPAGLLEALAALGLPEPVEVLRTQRWTHAKPIGSREALFSLSSKGIGLCGDGWGRSRVETAWLSGTALGQALAS